MISDKRGKIMENDLILQIDNVGPIAHAKIDIGKINIIGGQNSTGKSTASKILYCFLRANAPSSEKLVFRNIVQLMRHIIRKIKTFSYKKQDLSEDLPISYYKFIEDDDNIITKEESEELDYIEDSVSEHFYGRGNNCSTEDIIYYAEFLNNIFEKISEEYDVDNRRFNTLKVDMDTMNETINNILYNPKKLYESILKQLIASEFNIQGISDFGGVAKLKSRSLDVADVADFKYYNFSHENSFPIEQIYYLDSFSIFDRFRNGLFDTDHVKSLRDDLKEKSSFKAGIHDNLQEIIQKIEENTNDLIKGKVEYTSGNFEYISEEGVSSQMKNTASGIKQIGVIQRLLSNFKLSPGSFLFIDEPEVNLHPEWQAKFAGVLLLLVKDLDVSLYINTHSPIFIEAIRTFSEKYDLLEETNFYLTKEVSRNKFSFDKILSDDLYIIYEELGKPYDYLDDIQISNMFKDRIKKDISNIKD